MKARTMACVGPSYMLADRKSAAQRSVNLFMRQVEGLGEAHPLVMESCPGIAVAATLPANTRGIYATDTRLFVASGSSLYEVAADMTYSTAGSLRSTAGRVSMRHGTGQLAVVDGSLMAVLSLDTGVMTNVVQSGWRGSYSVDEIDGYFIFIAPDSQQFYISSNDDATTIDALDFSSADASPDDLLAQVALKRELYLFGPTSCEIWVDAGGEDFPFTRYNSTPIDIGIVGRYALTRTTDTVVWVGRTAHGWGYVYMMRGHQPVRISTQAVEEALLGSSDLAAASCWSYHTKGSEFVAVNAPGLSTTWVFDVGAQQWHERAELVDGAWIPLRLSQVAFFNGEHYGIDETTANIYRIDPDVYQIAGAPLVRERTWPHFIDSSFRPVSFRELELQCSTGNNNAGNVSLEISNDGGVTFGPPLIRSLGAVGRWMQRVRWLGLGSSMDRVFRIRCADNVPMTIHAAAIDAG